MIGIIGAKLPGPPADFRSVRGKMLRVVSISEHCAAVTAEERRNLDGGRVCCSTARHPHLVGGIPASMGAPKLMMVLKSKRKRVLV
jgi:hypothetical protein